LCRNFCDFWLSSRTCAPCLTWLKILATPLLLLSQLLKLLNYLHLFLFFLMFLCASDFYAGELTEHGFNRAVLRLNHNILRLCFSQGGINVVGINPRHTIVNLLMVLTSPDLGCVRALLILFNSNCWCNEGCLPAFKLYLETFEYLPNLCRFSIYFSNASVTCAKSDKPKTTHVERLLLSVIWSCYEE